MFVLASRYEGLPNALLEALALGAPAVVADCPGAMREIGGPEGQLVLVAPENPAALAKAILDVCGPNGKAERWRDRNDAVLRKFSVQQVVNEYSELF